MTTFLTSLGEKIKTEHLVRISMKKDTCTYNYWCTCKKCKGAGGDCPKCNGDRGQIKTARGYTEEKLKIKEEQHA